MCDASSSIYREFVQPKHIVRNKQEIYPSNLNREDIEKWTSRKVVRAKETTRGALLTQSKRRNQVDQYLTEKPSFTYRRSKNLKDLLVHSHHKGQNANRLFGSKGPKWGCKPCGGCVPCPNTETAKDFWDSSQQKKYLITYPITCNTVGVVYFATCPCNLIYIGLTCRELRHRVR
ncbi:uncharacterized protein LOC130356583 isoform X2 [Hyla sarda]|uniref:uncharacterized protein LOC130356583 isoform X2 n=1 Tax=Hyla sarda TaxID=327740 RepID=UPI0024C25149|nr:uncharacterized protein LOC130356583 isoform X2 [Hyla sarda]